MHGHIAHLSKSVAVLLLAALGGCSDDSQVAPPRDGRVLDKAGDQGPVADRPVVDAGPARELVILHTNDLHSSVEGWSPIADYSPKTTNDDATRGGFARLAALIKAERAAAGSTPVLLLDAGDFMQGSLFVWLSTSKYVELKLMKGMGYDATTLGNHELDWRPAGLAAMLDAAMKGNLDLPVMQPANLQFDATSPDDDALEQIAKAGGMKKKLVKTLAGGIKVGIFGLMGKGAAFDAFRYGAMPITFGDPAAAAKAMVKELRETDKVNLVICLSHGGIEENGTGEDAELASKVSGIDVIISGHSHTELSEPVVVGKTIIAQAGAHSRFLGKLRLKLQGAAVSLTKGELLPVDDKVAGEAAVQTEVDGYITAIDALLTAGDTGLTYKKTVVQTAFDLTFPEYSEAIMGNIIVDGYLATVKALQPSEPPDVAVDSNGVIGNPTLKGKTGKLSFADIYHAVPAGIGPDKLPGYPLVTFYLTGAELKAGMEVLAAAKGLLGSNSYFMQVAGMKLEYLAQGTPLNSVLGIKVGSQEVSLNDTSKCYKVVTNLLVGKQLAEVKQVSSGMLSIVPKEKDCKTPITDIVTRIVDRDPVTAGVQELKAWQAVVGYVSKFPDANGDTIPDVPEVYKTLQGRIVAK
jgi:5'-nucleotidase